MTTNMGQEEYIKKLENELDKSKEKYKEIYDSMRFVDKSIFFVKKSLNPVYLIVRNIYHKTRKKITNSKEETRRPPRNNRNNLPLATIYIENKKKTINFVMSAMSPETENNKKVITALKRVVEKANKEKVQLQIITRDSLPDPDVFLKILEKEKIQIPDDYSFYSDAPSRLSSSVRRLEVGKNDIFIYVQGDKNE